jgi:hypothetical protein
MECAWGEASSMPNTSARLPTAAGGLDNGGPLGLGDAGGRLPADAATWGPSAREPRCAATEAGTLARPHVDKSDAGTSQMIASGLSALALNSIESLCNAFRESCKYPPQVLGLVSKQLAAASSPNILAMTSRACSVCWRRGPQPLLSTPSGRLLAACASGHSGSCLLVQGAGRRSSCAMRMCWHLS